MDASVSSTKGKSKLGKASMGAVVSLFFNRSKAAWYLSVHRNSADFLVKLCRGKASKFPGTDTLQKR